MKSRSSQVSPVRIGALVAHLDSGRMLYAVHAGMMMVCDGRRKKFMPRAGAFGYLPKYFRAVQEADSTHVDTQL